MTDRSPTSGSIAERLAERARALARPAEAVVDASALAVESIVFRRGSERFALALRDLVEVARVARVTPLAGASAPVSGLAGWRGRVLTVLDLVPAAGGTPSTLVVAGSGRAAFAIVADDVEDARAIGAVTEHGATRTARWTRGVSSDAITILDLPALQRSLD